MAMNNKKLQLLSNPVELLLGHLNLINEN